MPLHTSRLTSTFRSIQKNTNVYSDTTRKQNPVRTRHMLPPKLHRLTRLLNRSPLLLKSNSHLHYNKSSSSRLILCQIKFYQTNFNIPFNIIHPPSPMSFEWFHTVKSSIRNSVRFSWFTTIPHLSCQACPSGFNHPYGTEWKEKINPFPVDPEISRGK